MKVLILCGGEGSEHAISLLSANYIEQQLKQIDSIQAERIELTKSKNITDINFKDYQYVIPCFHGYPGESGEVPSFLQVMHMPYLGVNGQGSTHCFNKVTTKLWLDSLQIPNSPWTYLIRPHHWRDTLPFVTKHQEVYIKAACQGSSVGCFKLESIDLLQETTAKAFEYSDYVIIEKAIVGRELELSAFEYKGKLYITDPGEVHVPKNIFYTYEQKYSSSSQSRTDVVATGLSNILIDEIKNYASKAWKGLNLKDLSRIDFFLDTENNIYLNEINTFPGMTEISLFPKMLEQTGIKFSQWLEDRIKTGAKESF